MERGKKGRKEGGGGREFLSEIRGSGYFKLK